MKTVHIVLAKGKATDVFVYENLKNIKTLCGREVFADGLANYDWWTDGQLCEECHKLSRQNDDMRLNKHYVTGVGDLK